MPIFDVEVCENLGFMLMEALVLVLQASVLVRCSKLNIGIGITFTKGFSKSYVWKLVFGAVQERQNPLLSKACGALILSINYFKIYLSLSFWRV